MYNPSFEELKEKGVNPYTLSLFLAKRARDIVDGDPPLVDTESTRPVSIALEEFFDGVIEPVGGGFLFGDEERKMDKVSQILDDDDYYDDEMMLEEELEEEEEDSYEKEEDTFDEDEYLDNEDDEEWLEDEE